jgi:uncharacterized protein
LRLSSGDETAMWKIDVARLSATPWRNGDRLTQDIACWPPSVGTANFSSRMSIADVAASEPFSGFPGMDRIIILLDGDGMRLTFAD